MNHQPIPLHDAGQSYGFVRIAVTGGYVSGLMDIADGYGPLYLEVDATGGLLDCTEQGRKHQTIDGAITQRRDAETTPPWEKSVSYCDTYVNLGAIRSDAAAIYLCINSSLASIIGGRLTDLWCHISAFNQGGDELGALHPLPMSLDTNIGAVLLGLVRANNAWELHQVLMHVPEARNAEHLLPVARQHLASLR